MRGKGEVYGVWREVNGTTTRIKGGGAKASTIAQNTDDAPAVRVAGR